jgi:hypothetical protein
MTLNKRLRYGSNPHCDLHSSLRITRNRAYCFKNSLMSVDYLVDRDSFDLSGTDCCASDRPESLTMKYGPRAAPTYCSAMAMKGVSIHDAANDSNQPLTLPSSTLINRGITITIHKVSSGSAPNAFSKNAAAPGEPGCGWRCVRPQTQTDQTHRL